MCLVFFRMIEQYCEKYFAKTIYFLYCDFAVTSFKIFIQFSKNIYLSIMWMTMA